MIAIREILNVVDGTITFSLPSYVKTAKVEVIIIPYISDKRTSVNFDMFFGVSNLSIEEVDQYINKARDEWGTEFFN